MKILSICFLVSFLGSCASRTKDFSPADSATPDATVATKDPENTPTPDTVGSTYAVKGIEAKLGVVSPREESKTGCLRTLNAGLKSGDKVFLVSPYEVPHIVSTITVQTKVPTSCVEDASDAGDEWNMVRRTSYYVVEPKTNTNGFLDVSGIAVIAPDEPTIEKGIAKVELTGTPPAEYFRECTSNEGMHFTVWSGRPLIGKRIWHRYYYLEYDTQPTCKSKETR